MVQYLVLISATFLVVHGAVLRSQDTSLRRTERSPCGTCGSPGQFPVFPPPPPPKFYTQNWNGIARNSDGSHQGVLTGAAAGTTGSQGAGEAFSLASSSVGVPEENTAGSTQEAHNFKNDASAGKASGQNFESTVGKNLNGRHYQGNQQKQSNDFEYTNQHAQQGLLGQQQQSNDFGTSNGHYSHGSYQTSQEQRKVGNGFEYGSAASSFSKDKQNQVQNQGHNHGFYGSEQAQSGPQTQKQDTQSNHFGSSNAGSSYGSPRENAKDNKIQGQTHFVQPSNPGAGSYSGNADNSQFQSYHQVDEGQKELRHSNFGNGAQGSDYYQGGYKNNGQGNAAELSSGNGQKNGNGEALKSTVRGALDLASQGLQASQQTACTTCGKSSYALSNAKSKTGDAIAVSIGG